MSISIIKEFMVREVFEEWAPGPESAEECREELEKGGIPYEASLYLLNFAILHRLEGVVSYAIARLKKGQLEKKMTDKRVTPLHMAVIAQNRSAAEALLEAGVNPDLVDKEGFSPLHHAALLGDRAMMTFLEEFVDPNLRTHRGATYRDIFALCGERPFEENEEIPLYWGEEGHLMTEEMFREETGAQFIGEVCITPSELGEEWIKGRKKESSFAFVDAIKGEYEPFLENRPVHRIAPVVSDSRGDAIGVDIGLGLFAGRSFRTGEIVAEFLGERTKEHNDYTLMDLNAEHKRNESAFVNDGFINLVMVPISDAKGLGKRYLFVAAEEIREGALLCWNYSQTHAVKRGPYIELRPDEAREFIANTDLDQVISALSHMTEEISLEEFILIEKMRYILDTPSVLRVLMKENVITSDQIPQLRVVAGYMDKAYPDTKERFEEIVLEIYG